MYTDTNHDYRWEANKNARSRIPRYHNATRSIFPFRFLRCEETDANDSKFHPKPQGKSTNPTTYINLVQRQMILHTDKYLGLLGGIVMKVQVRMRKVGWFTKPGLFCNPLTCKG